MLTAAGDRRRPDFRRGAPGRIPVPRKQAGRPGAVAADKSPAVPAPPAHYYCPDAKGPDWDFSAGVMLIDLPNGKSLVVAGQKSGVVWAYDPDKKAARLEIGY